VEGPVATAGFDATIALDLCRGRTGRVVVDAPRFLRLTDVAEILNISAAQTYALVRSGELPAIKLGGRGQWRVEREALEAYITRAYDETRRFVETHPFGRTDSAELPGGELDDALE
jgi:excisionase family DNA binding protein